MGHHGPPWASMVQHGPPWATMGLLGPPWASMGHRGPAWASMGHHGPAWATMGQHGPAWATMGHHGPPWATMGQQPRFKACWHRFYKCLELYWRDATPFFPQGKNWLNQRCFHIISTKKFNAMTLNQCGKLIEFAKSNQRQGIEYVLHPTLNLNPMTFLVCFQLNSR